MRRTLALLLLLPILLGQAQATRPDPAIKSRRDRLLKLYRGEAEGYSIFRDAAHAEKVELRPEPVYSWTNPIRGGEQDGDVFVWTYRGRAEVVGTFFSYPSTGPRSLNHEFHSLSTATLIVDRPGGAHTWTPKAPGVELTRFAGGPDPARTPSLRLAQMRELTRSFTATTEDLEGKRWELRLLSQPLYRYESTDPDVLDGAVFAFVTSAGTDPEVIVVVECRKPSGLPDQPPAWHHAVARFSDLRLTVRLKGKEIFKGDPIPYDLPEQDPLHRYRSFRDRGIPAVEVPTP